MGLLRDAFGPSQNEIWSQIAGEIGGELIDVFLGQGRAGVQA